MATPDLQRLAERVTERRLQLNLSVIRAADMAGVSKDTWKRVERASPVRHLTYDKIESALSWTVGSCRKIMDGGDAMLLDDAETTAAQTTRVPPEILEDELRGAIQGALISSTDGMTTTTIREVNDRAVAILRARGILPPAE